MKMNEDLKALRRRDRTPFPLYHDDVLCVRFHDAAVDILDDLMSTWEDSGRTIFHVTSPNSKFGAGTDGGFGGEVVIPLSYLDSTGSRTGDEEVDKRVELALDRARDAANKNWWERHYKAAEAAGLDPATLTYDAVSEAGLDAEEWDEAQRTALYDEHVALRFGLFYYGPDNTSPWQQHGVHEVYSFVVAEFDGAYLGSGMLTLWESTAPFDRDDESMLTDVLAAIAARIDGTGDEAKKPARMAELQAEDDADQPTAEDWIKLRDKLCEGASDGHCALDGDECALARLAVDAFMDEPTPAQKALELHDALIDGTESFDALCPTLPYLYAAILRGTYIDCEDTSEDMVGITSGAAEDPTSLLATLRSLFPAEHWVWQYIKIEEN